MIHPLIEVSELAATLGTGPVDGGRRPVILDVRHQLSGPSGRLDYDAGHIPGAVFVDVDTELSGPPGRQGRHPLPDQDQLTSALRSAGVTDDASVVVYDGNDGTMAARAWWLLRYYGHRDVRLLNGGYAAWVGAGQPVTTDAPRPDRGDIRLTPGHLPLIDAEGAVRVAGDGGLVDVRTAERFRGDAEPIDPVAGHIPGAINIPAGDSLGSDGRFLPVPVLREHFERLVTGDGPIATYCGSGITAAHQVLALELVGVRAALYADSWSGWIADLSHPVATGG